MKHSKIVRRLRASFDNATLVEISRSGVEMFPMVGIVKGMDRWVLIATVNQQFQAQGFDIMRLRDIDRVTVPDTAQLIERVVASTGSRLDRTPAVNFNLSSSRELAISVHKARAFTGICTYNHKSGHEIDAYPGRISEVRNRIVALKRLSASGLWDTSALSLPFSAIARYSFDSVRLRTYELFGQEYPGKPGNSVDSSAALPQISSTQPRTNLSAARSHTTPPGEVMNTTDQPAPAGSPTPTSDFLTGLRSTQS